MLLKTNEISKRKRNRFWKECKYCLGAGTVPASSPFVSDIPTSDFNMPEDGRAYCGSCHGCGVVLKANYKDYD